MPKAYAASENLDALIEVLHEAKRILEGQGVTDRAELDAVALGILSLAYKGVPPRLILGEIMPR
ncbi:hypothetical protein [Taklimakanibacter deserti]|uniref:hypothetical protein n=1 Tax=Taklimakanibacter deserti TaxID=2267839 RepID=UPI000E6563CA